MAGQLHGACPNKVWSGGVQGPEGGGGGLRGLEMDGDFQRAIRGRGVMSMRGRAECRLGSGCRRRWVLQDETRLVSGRNWMRSFDTDGDEKDRRRGVSYDLILDEPTRRHRQLFVVQDGPADKSSKPGYPHFFGRRPSPCCGLKCCSDKSSRDHLQDKKATWSMSKHTP